MGIDVYMCAIQV